MQAFAAILFSLVSANLNALAAVCQRRATGQVHKRELFRHRVLTVVIKNRLWLSGVALEVAGFFAQALALHNGSLVLVEPLLITDILFLLIYLHFFMNVHVGKQGLAGVGLLILGLSFLLATANPQPGDKVMGLWGWILATAIVGLVILVMSLVIREVESIPLRAGLAGIAAGLHFSFTAAVTKLVVNELHLGMLHTLFSWQLLLLIIVGVSSALTMQSMYGAGPLAISQPALEIIEALAGIEFGIILFGDAVNSSLPALAVEALAGLVAAVGVVLLARNTALRYHATRALKNKQA